MKNLTATCSLCEASCGALIDIEDDNIVRVRPDPQDPLSAGFICAKGAAIPEIEAHPARVKMPLIRADRELQPVTWDEAFAFIDSRVRAIHQDAGRDAIAIFAGNGAAHSLGLQMYLGEFIRALGTKNIFTAGTLDQIPRQTVSSLLFGSASSVTIPDLDRNRLLWILGANPAESNGSMITAPGFLRRFKAIQDRGGRVVVFDPRRTMTAKRADEHHAIRPSSDAAFLAGVVHVLLEIGPAASRALDLCGDLRALKPMFASFAPERVAPACGIDAATIRRLARELRDTASAALYGRIGTTTQQFSSLVCWLMDLVNILGGNLDSIGGAMFCTPLHAQDNTVGRSGSGRGIKLGRWQSRVRGAPEVLGELPASCLSEEILTPGAGQVRGLFVIAGNPVISTPDARKTADALKSLDLLVCHDIHLNQTAAYADVVLPSPPRLAKSNYDIMFYQFAVRLYGRYTPAYRSLQPHERSDRDILLRLAGIARGEGACVDIDSADERAMAAAVQREIAREGSAIPGRDSSEILKLLKRLPPVERRLDFAFRIGPHGDRFGARDGITFDTVRSAEHGLDLGPLRARLPEILRTTSGMIDWNQPFATAELARLSTWLAEERPPFVLVGRRQLRSNNSWMQHIGSLKHKTRTCALQMNPEDADKHGFEDQDRARVVTASGEIEVSISITPDIAPGVVSLPHGWGPDSAGRISDTAVHGANVNILTSDANLDPLTGTAQLNGYPVIIHKVVESSLPQL